MGGGSLYEVHFGGPNRPLRALRDLLAERIAAVPAGGSIDWITYYFRDRQLAAALVDAQRRGVTVRVTLEGRPRTRRANEAVVAMLSGAPELAGNLRIAVHAKVSKRRPHLHEKLYCFSHPRPVAYVGSFNPSGDDPEEHPEIIEEIRDQDRGYNLLVELRDEAIARQLANHARQVHAAAHGRLERFTRSANASLRARDLAVYFWPRALPNPVFRLLRRLEAGSTVRIAASHVKGPTTLRVLARLASGGVHVSVLAEETLRRVPLAISQLLGESGIELRRVSHPEGLPMHDKFMLFEQNGQRWVVFGSFNWTERSWRLNHEIGAVCTDPRVFEAFTSRWEELCAQADRAMRKTCADSG